MHSSLSENMGAFFSAYLQTSAVKASAPRAPLLLPTHLRVEIKYLGSSQFKLLKFLILNQVFLISHTSCTSSKGQVVLVGFVFALIFSFERFNKPSINK